MTAPRTISRRGFVLAAGTAVAAGCGSARGRSRQRSSGHNVVVQVRRINYGADGSQFGELYRPATGAHRGVIVLIHGGFWRSAYDLSLGRPLARDLAGRGFTCWNLEYRRVGDGGGWPATFEDVASGIDKLADLEVDSSTVVAVGHSAGGHLAVWAAGRGALPADAPETAPKVPLTGAVSQAGVLDLRTAARTRVGGTAVPDLLGGSPDAVAARYRLADPIEQVPLRAPVLCLHSRADANVPYAQSTAYVAAATAAGGMAKLDTAAGDHFTLIDPSTQAWSVVRNALPALLRGELP